MKIHELKELTNLSLLDLSKKTQIPYKRILKLNKQTLEHSTQDYNLINKYLETRGMNVIKVDFKVKREKRAPFIFERRKEINLHEYKRNKRKKERAERKEEQYKQYLEELTRAYNRQQN